MKFLVLHVILQEPILSSHTWMEVPCLNFHRLKIIHINRRVMDENSGDVQGAGEISDELIEIDRFSLCRNQIVMRYLYLLVLEWCS